MQRTGNVSYCFLHTMDLVLHKPTGNFSFQQYFPPPDEEPPWILLIVGIDTHGPMLTNALIKVKTLYRLIK